MCKSIHFSIYIRKPYVFFPLLATTGAASVAQYRRFSLQFCDFLYQNEDVLNIFHINPRYFSLLSFFVKKIVLVFIFPLEAIYIRKPHIFFPLLATTGAASLAQYCSDALILAAVF